MTAAARPVIDLRRGGRDDIGDVMAIMLAAFDPRYGEAWSEAQLAGMLIGPAVRLTMAYSARRPVGFALIRTVVDEAELLLLATDPREQGRGIGAALLRAALEEQSRAGTSTMFLEVRRGNPAERLYRAAGFACVGERRQYYRGDKGQKFDAKTYRRSLR